MKGGYTGQVLRVDLSNRKCYTEDMSETVARRYLGGRALSAYLLSRSAGASTDPLSAANPIVFAVGPLTGTPAFAPSGYFATISPLTNCYLDSGIRGRFPSAFKGAGFDALVIEGASEEPVYLFVHEGKAEIRSAAAWWGKNCHETEDGVRREVAAPRSSVVSIGPAGENLVRYACVTGDRSRQAGRGGLGAVFGAKKLKAIVAVGQDGVRVARPREFLEHTLALHRQIQASSEPLRSQGTMWLVEPMAQYGMLPVRNFTAGACDIERISGAYMARRKRRNAACYSCSLCCSNFLGSFHPSRGVFTLEGPEYETAALLGTNCGVTDLDAVAYLNLVCDELGLDTMSAGGTLAFWMELHEKGLGVGSNLQWGDVDGMAAMLHDIAYRKGEGELLAQGSRRAAQELGNGAERYAMHVKGMELPGYDPRGAYGMALAYATSDRGACHLRAWTIYEEVMGKLERLSPVGKAGLVIARQHRKLAMDSLGICEQMGLLPLFADLLSDATGWEVEPVWSRHYEGMLESLAIEGDAFVAERAYNLTRALNVSRGFAREHDTLPDRFFEESLPAEGCVLPPLSRRDFERMLDEYYALRGWDERGRPTPATMDRLGLGAGEVQ